MSDPLVSRLDRRRANLMQRFAMIEASGELEDAAGGEIAYEAIFDEMEFLVELQRVLLLLQIRENVIWRG